MSLAPPETKAEVYGSLAHVRSRIDELEGRHPRTYRELYHLLQALVAWMERIEALVTTRDD